MHSLMCSYTMVEFKTEPRILLPQHGASLNIRVASIGEDKTVRSIPSRLLTTILIGMWWCYRLFFVDDLLALFFAVKL